MNRRARSMALATTFLAVCLSSLTWAAEQALSQGDVGTVSKTDLEKVHPAKPPYSPYAGRRQSLFRAPRRSSARRERRLEGAWRGSRSGSASACCDAPPAPSP